MKFKGFRLKSEQIILSLKYLCSYRNNAKSPVIYYNTIDLYHDFLQRRFMNFRNVKSDLPNLVYIHVILVIRIHDTAKSPVFHYKTEGSASPFLQRSFRIFRNEKPFCLIWDEAM